ncbi:hypothetical protein [Candidatus Poriferisocius sp.]|uniref:hypothetical protein n=1 Tax=Candidatus Poriferisocius sp. TaxID=3101276 RepID=UPI003B01CFCC
MDAVAERSGTPVDMVADLLKAKQVPTIDIVGAPHRLRVKRLAFTGKKAGVSSEDIDFNQTFGDGLWAFVTEKNDRGKTSVMEIMMWALRGQPKRLQDDVRSWLHTVTLEGTVDASPFTVHFDLVGGVPGGSLTHGGESQPFSSDAAFADTMSMFMMEKLGFDTFPQWVNNRGISIHGWPLYSTVLYLPRESQNAVIGDTTKAGLAQRLVQLFIGVRWARTRISSQAALKAAQSEHGERAERIQVIQDTADGILEHRRQELADATAEIAALPSDLPTDEEIEQAREEWLGLISRHADVENELREARRDAREADREATRQQKILDDFTEAALARKLFQGLNPVRCPRCTAAIDEHRREAEKRDHLCALCNRQLNLELDAEIEGADVGNGDIDETRTAEELEQLINEAREAAADEQARVAELEAQAESLAVETDAAKGRIDEHNNKLAVINRRRELEAQVAAIQIVIEDLGNLAVDAPTPVSTDSDVEDRIRILEAAAGEAKQRVDTAFAEVMGLINQEIFDLARRFGLENLQEVRLNLAAQLRLKKGDVEDTFSKQTPGEKLRLRIAVIVALLRVAHNLGIGRHPGLLLIDSIGAEETEPSDLAAFMRELGSVTNQLGIQTIVASARPEVSEHVAENRCIIARGEEYLW